VNTNGLAKHYDKLTPWERLPLIAAAHTRGDETEATRLVQSAPTVGYRMPDYYGHADAVTMLALFHIIAQLDRATVFWQSAALESDLAELAESKKERARCDHLWDLRRLLAYRIVVEADALARLSTEMGLNFENLLRGLSGYETMKQSERDARQIAFTPEEATAFLRRDGSKDAEARAVEETAKGMRYFLDKRLEWWD
jgi:hypothetical protein